MTTETAAPQTATPSATPPAQPAADVQQIVNRVQSLDQGDDFAFHDDFAQPWPDILFSDNDATAVDPESNNGTTGWKPPAGQPRNEDRQLTPEEVRAVQRQQEEQGEPPATPQEPVVQETQPNLPQEVQTEMEQLRHTVEELQELKRMKEDPEFDQAVLVYKYMRDNPKDFFSRYMPDVLQSAMDERAVLRSNDVQEFVTSFVDSKTAEKYGEEFEYNPMDAGIKGTPSFSYMVDRQAWVQEGAMLYHQVKAENQQKAETQRQQHMQIAHNELVKIGVPAEKVQEAITEAMNLTATPEQQIQMAFLWMREQGLLDKYGVRTAGNAQPNQTGAGQPQRRTETPPPPSVPPGGGRPVSTVPTSIAETFPADFFMDSGF